VRCDLCKKFSFLASRSESESLKEASRGIFAGWAIAGPSPGNPCKSGRMGNHQARRGTLQERWWQNEKRCVESLQGQPKKVEPWLQTYIPRTASRWKIAILPAIAHENFPCPLKLLSPPSLPCGTQAIKTTIMASDLIC